jgi:hypothetical protein
VKLNPIRIERLNGGCEEGVVGIDQKHDTLRPPPRPLRKAAALVQAHVARTLKEMNEADEVRTRIERRVERLLAAEAADLDAHLGHR